MHSQKYTIHNIPIVSSNYDQAMEEMDALLKEGKGHFICFVEANLLYNSLKNEALQRILQTADYSYPDGIVFIMLNRAINNARLQRVSGPTYFLKALEYGLNKNWRHFFYGGAEGVADSLAETMKKRFPGLIIAGTYSPPFRPLTEEEDSKVMQMINDTHPDIVWVGLGGPKQEFWMYEHRNKIDAPVMLGVGAAFDFHSGNRKWASPWIRRLGLEWAFRMLSGGKRIAIRNLKCVVGTFIVLIKDYLFSHANDSNDNHK